MTLGSKKYKIWPLHKSHKDHGFIEPIKHLHVGISEVTKISNETYIASSLSAHSLLFFKINKDNSLKVIDNVNVYERVRDIKFYNNQLYLFLVRRYYHSFFKKTYYAH